MRRILVLRGGAIGDFILTLPALKLLRESFPAAEIELLGYRHIVRLAELAGYVNATRSIDYAPLASFFAQNAELAPELVAYFAAFDQIISYLYDPDQVLLENLTRAGAPAVLVGSPRIEHHEHAARQLARPLEKLGLHLKDPAARIWPSEEREFDPSLFALHPGSGSEAKNWPLERLAELSGTLLERNPKLRLLLVAGEADRAQLAALRQLLPNDRVETAEDLPLTDLAFRLRRAAFFLGHDSGISHLAAAAGTPCLLLFGPTGPAVWAPANPGVKVLRASEGTMAGLPVKAVLSSLGEIYELMRIGIRT